MSAWEKRTFGARRAATASLGIVLAAAVLLAGAVLAEASGPPPNFVVILVDDLGWADLGCYGSTYHETPNVDRLAAAGMRFTSGYASAAICSPTRAAIQTGRYPARLGLTDWIRATFQGGTIPEDGTNPTGHEPNGDRPLLTPRRALWMELSERTIAEVLKEAGYATGHIGKWHLGFEPWYPDRQGYDRNVAGCDVGQPPSYFDPYEGKHGRIPTLEPRRAGEYLTDREADEAVRFLRDHRDRPFYLEVCHYAVHTPIEAKREVAAKYERKKKTHQRNAKYAAMVESVDDATGRILAALDELGIADRTVVVFTSDNGGLDGVTSNLPLRSGKGYPYEGGIRVPWIVRWPGVVAPGTVCDEPVASVDLLPTIREAAGIARDGDDGPTIDGRSLVPLLAGKGSIERDAIFWHFPHYRGRDVVPYSIVRAGDWKLIRRYEGKEHELYDLASDLPETTDLSEKRPEKVKELERLLDAWLRDVRARMPIPNPDHEPDAPSKQEDDGRER